MLFNTFSPYAAERQLLDAVQSFQSRGVTDLVLDLRYNGGGLLAIASQLSYMVAGPVRTAGRVFERLQFNAAAGNRNPVTGELNTPSPFQSSALGFSVTNGTPLPNLNLARVTVLSTNETCSASEAVINALRGIGVEVVLIGSSTCGKPYGFYPTDNCGTTYYTLQFQGANDVGFADYADGFIPANSTQTFGVRLPGCAVADDFTRELGDPGEALLGTCPAQPGSSQARVAASSSVDVVAPLEEPIRDPLSVNRDMTWPGRN
jgi:carboxyl-terminal processing protease